MRRHARIVIIVVGLLVALAALGVWLERDRPRRFVQAKLAEALGARVRLGRLRILGLREFVLEDLTVRRMASQPWLDRLDVPVLVVHGGLTDIAASRFESLRFEDARLRLSPPAPGPAPETTAPPSEVEVGLLEVVRGRVVLAAGGDELTAGIEASLRGIGSTVEGSARLRSADVPFEKLLAVARGVTGPGGDVIPADLTVQAGTLASARADLRLSGGAADLEASAEARGIRLERDGRSLDLPEVGLDLAASRAAEDDPVSFRLTPRLPAVGAALVGGAIDPGLTHVTRLDASLEDVDLGAWAPVASLPEGWEIAGKASARVQGSPDSAIDYELHADLPRVRIPGPATASGATMEAHGAVRLDEGPPHGTLQGRLALGGLRGTIAGRAVPEGVLPASASIDGEIEAGDHPRFTGELGAETRGAGRLTARGEARLAGSRPEASMQWRWTGPPLDSLAGLAAKLGVQLPAGLEVSGTPSAQGTLEGSLDTPAARGKLEINDLGVVQAAAGSTPTWSFRSARVTAALRWSDPGRRLAVTLEPVEGELSAPPLEAVKLRAEAAASADPDSAEIRIERATADVGNLGSLRVDGVVKPGGEPFVEARCHVEVGDLGEWQTRLEPVLGDPLAGYAVKGKPVVELDLRALEDGRWSASGHAAITGSGLSSLDGARVVEGLDTTWELSAEGSTDGTLEARSSARVGGFQVLWGSFYADYGDLGADLSLDARFEPGGTGSASRWRAGGSLSLPDGPRLEATVASAEERPVDYTASLEVADLRTTFERYVRRAFEGSIPALEKLQVAGSFRTEAAGAVSDSSWSACGTLGLHDAEIGGVQGQVEVRDLDLDLPIDLARQNAAPGRPASVSGAEGRGLLTFEALKFGGIDFARTRTGLVTRGDSVHLEEGLAVPFLGGVLGFEELTLADLLRSSRHLATGILIHQASLEKLSEAMGILPLAGEIEGYFPDVRMTESTLRVEGDGEFSVFGGTLTIGDISGADLLSRYPKLTFSARFKNINLLQLTRTFDVGEMKGVLQGEIHDCELFRGVPVRCAGQIETVHVPGVGRTINVKAINNISILGTGGKVGALDRGIQKFFKHYTYDKLGIRFELSHDRFLLQGLEHRGNRELFLKGRLPFRIDVVNAAPGHPVSFKLMLERLGNVEFSPGGAPPPP